MHKINILLLSIAVCLGTACQQKAAEATATNTTTAPATTNSNTATAPIQPTNPSKHTPYVIEDSSKIKDLGNGLKLYVVKEGSGAKPSPTSKVMINYYGRLKNGEVFDESYSKPQAAEFDLANLIKGWQIGLTNVTMGSSFVLIVPPSLGYRSEARPGIPANSTLVFDIDLITFY